MLWYNIIEVIIMTASIHCKVDAEVKKQAEAVFKEAGLNTSTAINLFLKQAVIFKGIPFPIYTEKHNELNKLQDKKTLKKINDLIKDIERNKYTGLGSPEPLRGDLAGFWSRHIDSKNRLIYNIDEIHGTIAIAQCR